MFNRPSSFRLLGFLALIFLALLADLPPREAPGVPVPKPKPYALLYIPKKSSLYETNQYHRRQIALVKTKAAPFVLFWAIRSLKNADLPSLPEKGQGGENRFNNEEDVAWLEQNLKVGYLDGTGVLRISLAAGSPKEQALLVNAVVHAYFKLEVRPLQESYEQRLVTCKRMLKSSQEGFEMLAEAEKKLMEGIIAEHKARIERCEIGLRTLPKILELAEVPPE